MAKRLNDGRPICHACNRPFNPHSPGATKTMGPTCAQRAIDFRLEEGASQMAFDGELGSQAKPLRKKPTNRTLSAQRELPAHLRVQYEMAKMAFDDLFRDFCKKGDLLYGTHALAFDGMLNSGEFEVLGFDDPLLDWLEPEHELQLFLSQDGRTAYHRRSINGTVSLLHFKTGESASAKKYIRIIESFCRSLREYRDKEQMVQLPLFANELPYGNASSP